MHSASNNASRIPAISIHISFGYDRSLHRFYAFISHDNLTPHTMIRLHCVNQSNENATTLHLSRRQTITLARHTSTSMTEKIQHDRAEKNLKPLSTNNLHKRIKKNLSLNFQESEQRLTQHIQTALLLAITELQVDVHNITQMLYWGDGNLGETNGQKGPLFLMSPTLFSETFAALHLTSSTSIHRILVSTNEDNFNAWEPLYTKQREGEEWRKKWIPCGDSTPLCQYTDHFVLKNSGDKPTIETLLKHWKTTPVVTNPIPFSHWFVCRRTAPFDPADQSTSPLACSMRPSDNGEIDQTLDNVESKNAESDVFFKNSLKNYQSTLDTEDSTVRAFVTASI